MAPSWAQHKRGHRSTVEPLRDRLGRPHPLVGPRDVVSPLARLEEEAEDFVGDGGVADLACATATSASSSIGMPSPTRSVRTRRAPRKASAWNSRSASPCRRPTARPFRKCVSFSSSWPPPYWPRMRSRRRTTDPRRSPPTTCSPDAASRGTASIPLDPAVVHGDHPRRPVGPDCVPLVPVGPIRPLVHVRLHTAVVVHHPQRLGQPFEGDAVRPPLDRPLEQDPRRRRRHFTRRSASRPAATKPAVSGSIP